MIEHVFQTTVARSPEEAFDFLVDLRNAPQWEPYCRAVEKTSEGPIGVGTTFQESMTWGRKEAKIASFERPALFATQERARGTDCGVEFHFDTKSGGTQVTGRLWMQQHGVLRVLEPLMRLRVRRSLGEVPERLRHGIEALGTQEGEASGGGDQDDRLPRRGRHKDVRQDPGCDRRRE